MRSDHFPISTRVWRFSAFTTAILAGLLALAPPIQAGTPAAESKTTVPCAQKTVKQCFDLLEAGQGVRIAIAPAVQGLKVTSDVSLPPLQDAVRAAVKSANVQVAAMEFDPVGKVLSVTVQTSDGALLFPGAAAAPGQAASVAPAGGAVPTLPGSNIPVAEAMEILKNTPPVHQRPEDVIVNPDGSSDPAVTVGYLHSLQDEVRQRSPNSVRTTPDNQEDAAVTPYYLLDLQNKASLSLDDPKRSTLPDPSDAQNISYGEIVRIREEFRQKQREQKSFTLPDGTTVTPEMLKKAGK